MRNMDISSLEKLAALIRYYILLATTEAGSGHPTSSLSAVELMTALLFGGVFRFDPDRPDHPANDRLIFSKGHASPLLYALWAAAGKVSEEELRTLRKFGSPLEGHPMPVFPYTEAPTGSLGQGLSIGLGMALNAKYLNKLPYRTYVLLGDSEMTEGSQWEAILLAARYKLDNLIGILDVNRLGQRGETIAGRDTKFWASRIAAFGWETMIIDGHSFEEIIGALRHAGEVKGKPVMIVASTLKGKGISFLEDKEGWHGKALSREEFARAVAELGNVDSAMRGTILEPSNLLPSFIASQPIPSFSYPKEKQVATRRAYGNALKRIALAFPSMVALDAEVSNSTYAEIFKEAYPNRFFEMYVAEQNMVGAALGLARRGNMPFVSTFAAFFTRAFDQVRMAAYGEANIKFVGSHTGVSIGEDGPSQMGLEDLAMFRALFGSVVLYPADAVSCERLVEEAAAHRGIVYIRTTRKDTSILYDAGESFPIGGSKTLKKSNNDRVTVVAAGITLHETLAAGDTLERKGIAIRIIDCYSIKPIDTATLREAARDTGRVIVVEDHAAQGGLADGVREALADEPVRMHSLAVRKIPKSGKPDELLAFEEIGRDAIVQHVESLISESGHASQVHLGAL